MNYFSRPHLFQLHTLGAATVIATILSSCFWKSGEEGDPPMQPSTLRQFEGVRWLVPGQKGVTFPGLFGDHLGSANVISVVDPWLKSYRQIRLFGEFLECLTACVNGALRVDLITSQADEHDGWALGQMQALVNLQETFRSRNIDLRVRFDDNIHDRWVQTDEWTIMLGKGFDIWESSACYHLPQDERPVSKKIALTYVASPRQEFSSRSRGN